MKRRYNIIYQKVTAINKNVLGLIIQQGFIQHFREREGETERDVFSIVPPPPLSSIKQIILCGNGEH